MERMAFFRRSGTGSKEPPSTSQTDGEENRFDSMNDAGKLTLDIKRQVGIDVEAGREDVSEVSLISNFEVEVPHSVKAGPTLPSNQSTNITSIGLKVLILLAIQNCSKNLLMRYVMKEQPKFLTSAAVIGVEMIKLVLSTLYILIIDKRPISSIITFLKEDNRNSMFLAVPAAAYSLQMSLEYVALANLDAAVFSVLVQSKLLATAIFSAFVLGKRLKYVQIISLVLLTAGVMLCNLMKVTAKSDGNGNDEDAESEQRRTKGVFATLGIALSSGFASVYTEKVIKSKRNNNVVRKNYSLAYLQVQLALVSLIIIGFYAAIIDLKAIRQKGLWQEFSYAAFFSVFNSAIGGLIVAAVLKYADAVLKGYATAISVVMTGVMSMVLFGTKLNVIYFLGIVNVVCAVLLYNGKDLNRLVCAKEATKG